jgi:alpha-glucuronidase
MTDHLSTLPATLEAFAHGDMSVDDLARTWRDAAQMHEPALPERYLEVLERLLNQLESSALFSEESCSFSKADMAGALVEWLKRAIALDQKAGK